MCVCINVYQCLFFSCVQILSFVTLRDLETVQVLQQHATSQRT